MVPTKAKAKVFHTSIAKVWLDDNGICRAVLAQKAEVGLRETKEFFELQKQVLGKQRAPVLFDMRQIYSSSGEARTYAAQHAQGLQATAIAILDNSSLGHILGNLFIKLSKPHFPTKLFSREGDALEWLKEL